MSSVSPRHPIGAHSRRTMPERLPHGRHPRRCDASDVARLTLALFSRFTHRVALYILPSGEVLRVSNPRMDDADMTDSFVGVYDGSACEADIVADILAMEG